jgi:hypothetical protein
MPGDHASVPHHWWGKYVSDLSEFAESYSTAYKWGNEVIDRSTGQKVWEPMPLVHTPFFPPGCADRSTRVLGCICCLWGNTKMLVSFFEVTLMIALEDGYLERLFLKESIEQGAHFDAPESVSKIVHP